MTSTEKPEVQEVHNILKNRQRTTKPRPYATSIENVVTSGRVVSEICVWTDRQTDRQTDTLITILIATITRDTIYDIRYTIKNV